MKRMILLALTAVLFLAACGKEKKRFDGTGGTVPEGKRLATMYTVFINTTSTWRIDRFEWDANGLLKKKKEYYGDTNEVSMEWTFSYEGVNMHEAICFEYESAHEYKYLCSYDGDNLTQIQYYRDNVLRSTITFGYDEDGQITSMSDGDEYTSFVWHDGNLMRESYDDGFSCTYRYDSHHNPYATLPKALIIIMDDFETLCYLSTNNVTRETTSDGSEYSLTYVYEDDYPSRKSFNISNESFITYFKYTDGTGSEPTPGGGSEGHSYVITTTVNNSNYGYVTGAGIYEYGATATLTAVPYNNYRFVSWDNGSTANPRRVTVQGDATYQAIFAYDEGGSNVTASVWVDYSYFWSNVYVRVSRYYPTISGYSRVFYFLLEENVNSDPAIVCYWENLQQGYTSVSVGSDDYNYRLDGFNKLEYWSGNRSFYSINSNGDTTWHGDWWCKYASISVSELDFNEQKISFDINATMYDLGEALESGISNATEKDLLIYLENLSFSQASSAMAMVDGINRNATRMPAEQLHLAKSRQK